ncbi:MAG: L-seryl-tRNA(Sec) selenium transferase, partial [Acidimicrobiia bacterium]
MATARPPSVDAVIRALSDEGAPRSLVAEIARLVTDEARSRAQAGEEADVISDARNALRLAMRQRLGQLVNATGVLLHTNLGRAPLHPEAVEAASRVSETYSNLEFDVSQGRRGHRAAFVHRLLEGLIGAQAALVVNNNAGGLFLTLAALAPGKTVPVSRGELIEIGGSYRLPELMATTGAILSEIGTTNRTRIGDYERAATPDTALLLKVHPSNYRIEGFSEDTALAELVALGTRLELPVVFDIGSGLLDEEAPWLPGPPPVWLDGEPGVRQSLKAGADLILFSGDKLLGGPQAGIITGKRALIEELAVHPIARALRADAATLAALSATVELYADGRGAEIPFWAMAALPYNELVRRSNGVSAGLEAEIIEGESLLGAGSVPGRGIPSPVIAVHPNDPNEAWTDLL